MEMWGSWSLHDLLPGKKKESLSIGVAATSQDPRLRHLVVAVVHHALKDGELYHGGGASRRWFPMGSPFQEPGSMACELLDIS